MYERILIPLDGSTVGEAALPLIKGVIAKFSPETKVEVTLFQVVAHLSHWVVAGETGARIPYTERELQLLKQETIDYLEKTAEGLRSLGVTVNVRVSFGSPAEKIIKMAEETNADLIAMSTHGRSGLSRWTFGSVTEKVLRIGTTPILTVRAPQDTANT